MHASRFQQWSQLPHRSWDVTSSFYRATSICLSVCPSVCHKPCSTVANRRITQITPHNRSWKNSNGATPNGRLGRLKLAIFDQHLYISQQRCKTSCYGRLIATRMRSIEWCYFPWYQVIPDLNYPKLLYLFHNLIFSLFVFKCVQCLHVFIYIFDACDWHAFLIKGKLTYLLTYLLIYLLSYLLTYFLYFASSFMSP